MSASCYRFVDSMSLKKGRFENIPPKSMFKLRWPAKENRLLNDERNGYGSAEWFVDEYRRVDDDPWGLSWRPSQKIRYERVLRLLDFMESQPRTVLDIGCATGDFTELLSKRLGKETIVTGIDFIDTAIDRAKERHRGVTFRKGSIFNIGQAYKETIDLVACLEVLY